MKIGVLGPRDFNGQLYDNYAYVEDVLAGYLPDVTEIISGGGKGTESLAQRWAEEAGVTFTMVRPNISLYGTVTAFHYRNSLIIEKADHLLCFWDGRSSYVFGPASEAITANKYVDLVPLA